MRQPRQFEDDGIYHIMARGNNKQALFLDWQDYYEYLSRTRTAKIKWPADILCFVLMPNHVHFIIKFPLAKNASLFMHGLQTSYSIYFNKKNDRVGHVFQGRFKSKAVKDDIYLLHLSRYIYLNPVEAQLVKKPEDYPWSSYADIGRPCKFNLVDTSFIVNIFNSQYSSGIQGYRDFVESGVRLESDPVPSLGTSLPGGSGSSLTPIF